MASSSPALGYPGTDVQPSGALPTPLLQVILATTVLCISLTTTLVAARLVTKRLVATFNAEDCEYRFNPFFRD